MSDFEWNENNLACVATYKVLEGDAFLDQFEDSEIPFKKAPDVKLGRLRYFPKTTTNPSIIEVLSIEIARKFLKHITKIYTVKKQNRNVDSGEIIEAIAEIFADPKSTIIGLAELVDDQIRFPNEA